MTRKTDNGMTVKCDVCGRGINVRIMREFLTRPLALRYAKANGWTVNGGHICPECKNHMT